MSEFFLKYLYFFFYFKCLYEKCLTFNLFIPWSIPFERAFFSSLFFVKYLLRFFFSIWCNIFLQIYRVTVWWPHRTAFKIIDYLFFFVGLKLAISSVHIANSQDTSRGLRAFTIRGPCIIRWLHSRSRARIGVGGSMHQNSTCSSSTVTLARCSVN